MSNVDKFEINGKQIEFSLLPPVPGDIKPLKKKTGRAPGSGSIEIEPLQLSVTSATYGSAVNCQTVVRGKNIAHIFTEILLETGGKKYGPFSKRFITSPENREVRGILHPRWSSENSIEFSFALQVDLLCCKDRFTLACMIPEKYGVDPEDQVWSTEGIYQRGGGVPFRVKFEYDHGGNLIRKTGFYDASADGVYAPFELMIEEGDTFEPYASIYKIDSVVGQVSLNPLMMCANTLPLWVQQDAPAGKYHIGVSVEDFDGKTTASYSPLSMQLE